MDNGCLWVLPGSHRAGIIYPNAEHQDAVPVEVPAGSALIFNGYLLHKSLPTTGRRGFRRALVNHYMSASSPLPWGRAVEGGYAPGHRMRTRWRPGFASFEQRFPWPAGWRPLDVRALPLATDGLSLLHYTDVETRLLMTFDVYLRYVLSEVNVDSAIARGDSSADEAHDWCRATLEAVFADGDVPVVIPGYVATICRTVG